ncbi:MAG: ribosomal protein L13e [Candidatus Bathyarchaeota archaeon]|nr:ribosomal protein L13e [Candidatus Bathyarchaeota archaeon]MDW8040168.1 ribosomal protein L13e [Nitrososphaerota archaeon]
MEALKPLVFKKGGKQRLGKGFSIDELKKVGLKPKQALKLGLPIDPRRKTVHEENVEKLKKLLETKQQEKVQKKLKPKEKPEQKADQKKEKGKTKRGKKKNKT